MTDLDGGRSSFPVDGIGNLFQSRKDIGTQPQLTFERQSALCDGGVSQGRHADPSGGYGSVIVI